MAKKTKLTADNGVKVSVYGGWLSDAVTSYVLDDDDEDTMVHLALENIPASKAELDETTVPQGNTPSARLTMETLEYLQRQIQGIGRLLGKPLPVTVGLMEDFSFGNDEMYEIRVKDMPYSNYVSYNGVLDSVNEMITGALLSVGFPSIEEIVNKYGDTVLEDDDTDEGGIDHAGETLREFVETADCDQKAGLGYLCKALVGCGIQVPCLNLSNN